MSGPVILVTRAHDRFSSYLIDSGCQVINLAVTETVECQGQNNLESLLSRKEEYDGFFITSPVAAQMFVQELKSEKLNGKVYVLGDRAKEIFEKVGIRVEYQENANTVEDLVTAYGVGEFAGKSYLFICGDRSMRTISDLLAPVATIQEVIVYNTRNVVPNLSEVNSIRKLLMEHDIGWMCFFAPSAVDALLKIFKLSEIDDTRIAAIGVTTAKKIKEAGLSVDFVSERATAADFASGLAKYIKSFE